MDDAMAVGVESEESIDSAFSITPSVRSLLESFQINPIY